MNVDKMHVREGLKKKKRKIVEFPTERLSGKKNRKMINSLWNECGMIWVL